MSTRATKLFRDAPIRPRRSASTPPPNPAEEKEPTRLWKALCGKRKLQYRPVQLIPELAAVVGDRKAALLSQLDYWMPRAVFRDETGRRWVYNTVPEWRPAAPGISDSTIKRLWRELEDSGYVLIGQFHVSRLPRENFYSLVYEKLAELQESIAAIAREYDTLSETMQQKRRFLGGAQSLLNGRYEVE